jgi:hypothetical protein
MFLFSIANADDGARKVPPVSFFAAKQAARRSLHRGPTTPDNVQASGVRHVTALVAMFLPMLLNSSFRTAPSD